MRFQAVVVDQSEYFVGLKKQPRDRVVERQPQAALDEQVRITQLTGRLDVFADVVEGRIAQKRGVTVDNLLVDPVRFDARCELPAALFELVDALVFQYNIGILLDDGFIEQQQTVGSLSNFPPPGRRSRMW